MTRTLFLNIASIAVLILFAGGAILSAADANATKSSAQQYQQGLTVSFENIEDEGGILRIALFNSQAGYESDDAFQTKNILVAARETVGVNFNDVPKGTYAIKVYHDLDKDRELDTNLIGIPSEDYAFSRNASAPFSAPTWAQTKFDFDGTKPSREIYLN